MISDEIPLPLSSTIIKSLSIFIFILSEYFPFVLINSSIEFETISLNIVIKPGTYLNFFFNILLSQ
jgi:hypothetical protein